MSSNAAQNVNDAANRASAAVSNASSNITQSTSSSWDRLAQWVSDNKAVAYTVAGVTLVATGGAVYYYTSSSSTSSAGSVTKPSKTERRRQKKQKQDEEATIPLPPKETEKQGEDVTFQARVKMLTPPEESTSTKATAESELEEELPTVTEENVGTMSDEVRNEVSRSAHRQ
jgi:import receptor subunit TOM70